MYIPGDVFFKLFLLFTVVPLSISKSCYRQVFSTEDIDKAIVYVSRSGKIENTHSLRKLARMGFESYISKEYKAGKITLREASVLLNLTLSVDDGRSIGYGSKGKYSRQRCPEQP